MVGIVLVVVLVVAVGTRVTDGVRLQQQQTILAKLPRAEAVEFYKILRRRMWKVHALRAITLLSLFAILYTRNRARPPVPPNAAPASQVTPGRL
jgi:hypothetical protein